MRGLKRLCAAPSAKLVAIKSVATCARITGAIGIICFQTGLLLPLCDPWPTPRFEQPRSPRAFGEFLQRHQGSLIAAGARQQDDEILSSPRRPKGKSLWNAIISNGGQESPCGWCKDRWGLSWQITPRALTNAVMGADPAAAQRAFDAMMTMKKIDFTAIEAARRGA